MVRLWPFPDICMDHDGNHSLSIHMLPRIHGLFWVYDVHLWDWQDSRGVKNTQKSLQTSELTARRHERCTQISGVWPRTVDRTTSHKMLNISQLERHLKATGLFQLAVSGSYDVTHTENTGFFLP